jgi:hypothetical protein
MITINTIAMMLVGTVAFAIAMVVVFEKVPFVRALPEIVLFKNVALELIALLLPVKTI